MPTLSFPEELNLWEVLSTNLKPHLETMPHLGSLHQEMTGIVVEARGLENLRSFHEAELRETNRKRREIEKKGRELRNRVAAALQSNFGPYSERLLEFGVKPRAQRRRKAKKPVEGEEQTQKPRSA